MLTETSSFHPSIVKSVIQESAIHLAEWQKSGICQFRVIVLARKAWVHLALVFGCVGNKQLFSPKPLVSSIIVAEKGDKKVAHILTVREDRMCDSFRAKK